MPVIAADYAETGQSKTKARTDRLEPYMVLSLRADPAESAKTKSAGSVDVWGLFFGPECPTVFRAVFHALISRPNAL